jgi:histidinol dehydrogenase
VKVITVQQYDIAALRELGPAAIALAEAEGLMGHADAIRARGIASTQPGSTKRKAAARA